MKRDSNGSPFLPSYSAILRETFCFGIGRDLRLVVLVGRRLLYEILTPDLHCEQRVRRSNHSFQITEHPGPCRLRWYGKRGPLHRMLFSKILDSCRNPIGSRSQRPLGHDFASSLNAT